MRATFSIQCSDTSGLYKAGYWFVGGDDLTGSLHTLQLQLSPTPPSFLAPRMETFWYRFIWVNPWNGR